MGKNYSTELRYDNSSIQHILTPNRDLPNRISTLHEDSEFVSKDHLECTWYIKKIITTKAENERQKPIYVFCKILITKMVSNNNEKIIYNNDQSKH